MPDYIRNVLKFKNLKSDDIQIILDLITSPASPVEIPGVHYKSEIDFNKIIPEPITKEECPKEYLLDEYLGIARMKDKPWFNWYDWHIANWGTKWNACDSNIKVGKSYITFAFSTAWDLPWHIYKRLSLLNYDMEIRYANEELGSNCGKIIYNKSEQRWTFQNETDLRNPYNFARDLWKKY